MTDGAEANRDDEHRLRAGALVGSYEIVELIGAGGMGEVYRARHKAIGRAAAVKVLKAERARDAAALDLFLKEATTLGALSHRNLVEVLDFGHLPTGQPFLTMAFIDGKTLHDVIAESMNATGSGLTVSLALLVTEQVLNALGEAHKKGIVHRDLKPANIMLLREHSGEQLVKVLDFGLSRPAAGAVLPWAGLSSAKTSSAAGTPAYASPEQIRNEDLDGRSDLYSLGCTMFEMLAGRPPFVAESPLELVRQHLDAPPPALADFVRNVPEEVERLVLWFLQKHREERPESADVARLEVRRLITKLSRENTVVRGPSSLPSMRRLSRDELPRVTPPALPEPADTAPGLERRRPRTALIAAMIGLLLVAAGAVAVVVLPQAPAVVVQAQPLPIAEPPPPTPPEPEVNAGPAEPVVEPKPEGPAPAVAAPGSPEAPAHDEGDDLAAIAKAAPGKVVAKPGKHPAPACAWSDDFKALSRKDHQALQRAAAQRGTPRATLDDLEDAFGDAMVKQDCRGVLRVLDRLRRHASSR
ncbi:MAG: protein kinase [Myxococcaceae bacterium]|nr:protein kinase [Myxococcaceae bacterium]